MWKYEGKCRNMKEYVGNTKKYVGNMKKYERNMKKQSCRKISSFLLSSETETNSEVSPRLWD